MNVKIEKLFLRLKTNSLEIYVYLLPKTNIQENNKKESVSSFDDEEWEKIDDLDEDYGDQSDDEDE